MLWQIRGIKKQTKHSNMIDTQKFSNCLTLATNLLKASRGLILVITGEGDSGKSLLVKKICDLFPEDKCARIPTSFLVIDPETTNHQKLECVDKKILLTCDEFEDWNKLDLDFVSTLTKDRSLIVVTPNPSDIMAKGLESKMTLLKL